MKVTNEWSEKELGVLRNLVPEHQHKYTVAVEWKEIRENDYYGIERERKVTVLRCESCPDEITREVT